MLSIYRSNRMEVLVAHLAALLDQPEQRPVDVFAPLKVVVGSQGMERYLRHELASQLRGRICANVEFPFPASLQSDALRSLESGASSDELWSPSLITWAILDVLPELLQQSDARLAPLRAYLGDDSVAVSPKTWSLAGKLGDLFDRYVYFRPELAVGWSRGETKLDPTDSSLSWQPLLWQAVCGRLGANNHFAARWLGALRGRDSEPDQFDQPVRFFGVTHLPPPFLHQLAQLSQDVDVDLFVLCPSNAFWGYIERVPASLRQQLLVIDREEVGEQMHMAAPQTVGHPLLASLGRLGRDLQLSLESVEAGYVDKTEHDWFLDPAAVETPTALQQLQSDLLHLRDPRVQEERYLLAQSDHSLQFHACFGPARQVEALRELLLHLFEAHPHLEARDVLVITPDIEVYAPLVSGVFETGLDAPSVSGARWGPAGAPRIAFEVAQRSMRRSNPVADVLLRVLKLAAPGQRLSASVLLDLFAVEPFRDRFGLRPDDLPQIRLWVQESGFRWGINAADRAGHDQPELSQNTLVFALERLALGVCMADAPGRLFDASTQHLGVVPHDALEGGLAALLGRVIEAVTTLIDEVEALRNPRAGGEWIVRFLGDPTAEPGSVLALGTLGRLTTTTASSGWLDQRVRVVLKGFQNAAIAAGATRRVQVAAMHAALSDQFDVAHGALRSRTGAVTFAGLKPFRSVPFPVVCLLGFDDGCFPASSGQSMFDLTERHPRVGDPNARDEDRHLLLEAILAAREHLVILYTGRDVASNEARAPAVPIGEFREVVDATFETASGQPASAAFTRDHPLQGFSAHNFHPDSPWSFDRRLLAGAKLSQVRQRVVPVFYDVDGAVGSAPPETVEEVRLADLVWYLRNPAKRLLNASYGLFLNEVEDRVPDREPVEVDDLGRYALCRRLLDARVAGLTGQASMLGQAAGVERVLAEGELPLGVAGRDWLNAPAELVDALVEQMRPWVGVAERPVAPDPAVAIAMTFNLSNVSVRLTGEIGRRWGRDQLYVAIGDAKPRALIEPWLSQVAWAAFDGRVATSSVLIHGKLKRDLSHEISVQRIIFLPNQPPTERQRRAREFLGQLLRFHRRGLYQRERFFCAAGYAFAHYIRPGQSGKKEHNHVASGLLKSGGPYDDHTQSVLDKGLERAVRAFEGHLNRGEGYDPHVQRLWDDGHPLYDGDHVHPEFAMLSRWFWRYPLAGTSLEPRPLGRLPEAP